MNDYNERELWEAALLDCSKKDEFFKFYRGEYLLRFDTFRSANLELAYQIARCLLIKHKISVSDIPDIDTIFNEYVLPYADSKKVRPTLQNFAVLTGAFWKLK